MRWVRVATLLLVILFGVPSPPHLIFAQPQLRDILVSPTTGEGVGSIWGVFIGVSQYKHKEFDLQFADQDAEALFQFFSTQFLGKIPADHFTLLKNEEAQRGPILRALKEVLRRSQPEDLVIISMAMHGLLDPTGQDLYFMTHDADPNFPEDDGISRDDMLKQINKSKARKIVLLLDACHTGAFGSANSVLAMRSADTADINRLLIAMGQAQDGLAVLSSSSAAERSQEGEIFCGGHGAFTCALLTGLQGEADTNRNGLVEVRELYDFTYRTVKTSTDGYQNPDIDGEYDNGLPLAYVGDQGIGEARASLGPGTPSDHTSEELSLVLQELKALKEQLGHRPAQKTEPNGNTTAEELARLREEVKSLKEQTQEPPQEKPTRPKGEGKPAESFKGTGTAVVVGGDKDSAVKLAEHAAVQKAVSQAIESQIQKGTKEEFQYNVKRQELLKGPFPFVTNQRLVGSDQQGKLLKVSVEIQVNAEKLLQYLGQRGILAHRMEQRKRRELPPIMVLVSEEINGKEHTPSFCRNILSQTLLEKGFDLVDEEAIRHSIEHDKAVQSLLKGNQRAAVAMASQYGAGIIISGRATADKSDLKAGGMTVHGANVVLQAYRADSAQVFASASADGSYPHVHMLTGSRKAVEEATDKALTSLLKDFQRQFETSESKLLVSISGITFPQLEHLKSILRDPGRFPALTDIQPKSFQAKVAKLQFTITNSPQEFVDHVATYDFGKFTLDVLSYSPRKIDFSFRLKSRSRG